MPTPDSQPRSDGLPARRVSVCVATCGRPVGLGNLLGALEALEIPAEATLQVVVVDNDPSGSAKSVCDEVVDRHAYPLRYVVEKRRGIPFARNAALSAALSDSDFIAFIDDDEIPESDWLAELLRVQTCYRADVVTGPCIPRYVEPPPRWVSEGRFHDAQRYPTGSRRHVAFTHNALVRSTVFDSFDRYFDESMALNGGDDHEFFSRVFAAGFQIIWADNAIVHESVPASRSTVGWILQRGFRAGTSTAWVESRNRSGVPLRLLVHGIYCMAKGAAFALTLPLRGRASAVEGLRLFSYGLGRIAGSSGYLHQEYRVVHGA
ncbi:MAG: glycosyltransferase family 2 protein [Deltaproteobacteria bacterium]|nr:glycosyltransferase family 2 protein [Deltaproteobacteria bacterium]